MPRYVRVATDEGPRFGVVDGSEVALLDGHPFSAVTRSGERLGMEGLRLLAPVIPTKVVAVGRNYAAHAEELGNAAPAPDELPLFFLKPSSSDEAAEAVFGHTCANDVTARDLQGIEEQWFRAKGFDTFCPLGPAIATDLDASDLRIQCLVDGEVRQDGSTSEMVLGVPELLSAISQVMTLLPSDVVLTGTPAGVGPLHPGETVGVEIDGIGALLNPVVDRTA